jgi:hypothetical protein
MMDQIKAIVSKTYAGIVKDPTKLSEYVVGVKRDFVLFDYTDDNSVLFSVKDGDVGSQSAVDIPAIFNDFVAKLNQDGKVLESILMVSKKARGVRVQYVSSSSPASFVAVFALGLRVWGAYLDSQSAFTSLSSILKKYGSFNGLLEEDGLTSYPCREDVLALPYQEDLHVVSSDSEYLNACQLIDSAHKRDMEKPVAVSQVLRDLGAIDKDGNVIAEKLMPTEHPAALIRRIREDMILGRKPSLLNRS